MKNNELTYPMTQDIQVIKEPTVVLEEARKAAKALTEVIKAKKKPFIIRGETYLEFEDWQTIARFYGVTAKVTGTNFLEMKGGHVQGYEAKAVALRPDGQEISGAESMCLDDEDNWKKKPLYQLRSMAQTRACAKVLRNVLSWVVVLGGFKPTPAEEMPQEESAEVKTKTTPPKKTKEPATNTNAITKEQLLKISGLFEKLNFTDAEERKAYVKKKLKITVNKAQTLTKQQAVELIEWLDMAIICRECEKSNGCLLKDIWAAKECPTLGDIQKARQG